VDVKADGGGGAHGVAGAQGIDDLLVLAERALEVPAEAQGPCHVSAHPLDQLRMDLDQAPVARLRDQVQVKALVRGEEALHRLVANR
jgi:hypothetical protein